MTSHTQAADCPQSLDATDCHRQGTQTNAPMRHCRYLAHLDSYIDSRSDDPEFIARLHYYEKEIHILKHLDLDPAIPSLISLYSPGKFNTARDPAGLLRSLILMTLLRVRGITAWVSHTKQDPLLTVLIGFKPGRAPEVGTYYAFMKRIIDGPWRRPCRCKNQLKRSEYNSGHHKRNLQKEKLDKKNDFDPYHSKSEKLAGKLLDNEARPRSMDLYKILEDLHIQLGVIPSIRDGLLTDLKNLVISGDGSILQSGADPNGKPVCNCRSEGVYKCGHDRYYTSPTAEFCYDHVHNHYIFGDRYYHLVTTQGGHDFPLLTYMAGGNESDYTLSLTAIDRFLKALSENNLEVTISTFIGDGHHDAYAHYHYLQEKHILPVIPLSKPSQKAYPHLPDTDSTRLDEDGTPLCKAGKRMRHHCYDKKKNKHVYSCPAKRHTHRNGKSIYVFHKQDCPEKENCDTRSILGPYVYLKSSTDPRLFPPLHRSSQKFKDLMNQRSASERCNFINDSYKLEGAHRNADYSLIRLTLANIAHHATIRYQESRKRLADNSVPASLMKSESDGTSCTYQDSG